MEFRTGLAVKPKEVLRSGQVVFTDGTTDVTPNQIDCEAYGYTYNHITQTCEAYSYTMRIQQTLSNETNTIKGSTNTTETGTANTYVIGDSNVVKGEARNNIIVGSNNEIVNGVNNVGVYGTLGQATASNSIVLGGNSGTDILSERQSIQLIYGTQTTQGSTVHSYLNNITDNYFSIPDNCAMYFHADVLALRVGGTGTGNAGDFLSWVERGVVRNASGAIRIERERDTIQGFGNHTNWRPTAVVSGTDFIIDVRGATDTTIEWCSNITFTQIKTGVAL
tara:strand:+ start:3663 stop:4499 length:837 start_codon:yes stop_codon:yes gene_type:complete